MQFSQSDRKQRSVQRERRQGMEEALKENFVGGLGGGYFSSHTLTQVKNPGGQSSFVTRELKKKKGLTGLKH